MSFIRKIKKGDSVYLAEVENVRVKGKVVQKHIRYIGKEADGKTILSSSISNLKIDQVKVFGPLLVLNHLAESIDLHQVLGNYSREILSMVYAHCIKYQSLNQMRSWYERTDLNYLLDLDGLTESRLVGALDSLEKLDSTVLHKTIFEKVKTVYPIDGHGIVYDVTNTYLYGKRCPFGKIGKDKDGCKGRPLIQIGLGVTQNEGIPVFHKIFDGNIHDARTLSDCITEFSQYDVNQGLIIFDRGISSKHNQKALFSMDWEVLCGLPLDLSLKRILRRVKAENSFLEYKNRVKLNRTVFYVVSVPHIFEGIKGKLTFCLNERLGRNIKESRFDEIDHAQKLLAEGKTVKPGLEQFFSKDGRLLKHRVDDAAEFDGYSCIFTTANISHEQLVHAYFDKDIVEKAFRSLKSVINLRPVRHWLYNRVIAHVAICYLAYLLLSLLNYKLKRRGLDISPVNALLELETLYKVYGRDSKKNFVFSRTVALNKQQEKILRAVDHRLLRQA